MSVCSQYLRQRIDEQAQHGWQLGLTGEPECKQGCA
jgi:hypothetical protein